MGQSAVNGQAMEWIRWSFRSGNYIQSLSTLFLETQWRDYSGSVWLSEYSGVPGAVKLAYVQGCTMCLTYWLHYSYYMSNLITVTAHN